MIDLHTHTFLSDGALLPEELVRRCEVAGYRMVVFADHVGLSNVDSVLDKLARLCDSIRGLTACEAIPGAELTHVRPELVERTVRAAREAGARLVLGHGETLSEPVLPGSNRAYIEGGVDVLAHPGLISEEDGRLAAEREVCLEISGRKGHCLANGHVARIGRVTGAGLVFGSDAHEPGDVLTRAFAERIAAGAGMKEDEIDAMFARAEAVFRRSAKG